MKKNTLDCLPSMLSYFEMTDKIIQFIKERQTKILNYSVLLNASLIYLYIQVFNSYPLTIYIFTFLSSAIIVYMVFFIIKTQQDLLKYRKRQLLIIEKHASMKLKVILGFNKEKKSEPKFWDDSLYLIPYLSIILLSSVLSILVFIYFKKQ